MGEASGVQVALGGRFVELSGASRWRMQASFKSQVASRWRLEASSRESRSERSERGCAEIRSSTCIGRFTFVSTVTQRDHRSERPRERMFGGVIM